MRLFPDIQMQLKPGAQAVVLSDSFHGADSVRRGTDGIPVAFRVFKPGVVSLTIDGKLVQGILDASDIQKIADHAAMKGELVPLDCEHFLKAVADQSGIDELDVIRQCPLLAEKAVAGGVELKSENGELWAYVRKLADRARTLLSGSADKLYMYFSPVLRGIKDGPLRVSSIALTNEPAINNLDVIAASDSGVKEEITSLMSGQRAKAGGMEMKEKLRKLCVLLKLDVAAFSADNVDLAPVLTAALQAIEQGTSREQKLLGDLKTSLALTDTDTLDTLAGKLLPIIEKSKTDATALSDAQTRIAALETTEKGRVIAGLKAEGKLTEAMLPWAERQSIVALTDWAKTAPVSVPLARAANQAARQADDGAVAMSDTAVQIAKRCGVDPAKVAKLHGLKYVASLVFAFLLLADTCGAVPLTENANTPEMAGRLLGLTQGSNVLYAGAMVALRSGVAAPAADASGVTVIGRCERGSDNTATFYAADKKVTVRRGVFRWANGGSFTVADIGQLAYVQDDHTVTTAAAATNDVIAGAIINVDSDGVWVDTYAVGTQGIESLVALNVTGAISAGTSIAAGTTIAAGSNLSAAGTLTVGGATTVTNITINGISVSMPNIPTSTNGLSAGRIWSNSGVLTIKQ